MNRIRIKGHCFAVLMALLALLPAAASLADELELANGTVYKGKLLGRDEYGVKFEVQMDGGGAIAMTIPQNMVKELRLGKAVPVTPAAPGVGDRPTWQSGKLDTRTREQVELLIAEAGKTPPAWLAATKLDYPKTLDLSWAPNDDAEKDLSRYFAEGIYGEPDKWHEGIKLLHYVLDQSKTPQLKARTAAALGEAYLFLESDPARAAWWYRQAGSKGFECELANCYRKLGCVSLAGQTLTLMPNPPVHVLAIRVWAQIGDLEAGLKLVDGAAREGHADAAYLAAGDACRYAGQYKQAIGYYQQVTAATAGGSDLEKYKEVAKASIDALKKIEAVELRKIADGSYTGESIGYDGPLTIEVVIAGGKITAAKAAKQTEDRPLTGLADVAKGIADAQGIKGVDGVTGATVTTDAMLNATAVALAGAMPGAPKPVAIVKPSPTTKPDPVAKPDPAKPKGQYADGVYTGEGKGHKSQIVLEITVRNAKIAQVKVVSQKDDARWWARALAVIPMVIQRNGTDGVNTVSRATHSSRGILTAAKTALDKAKVN
ncbi:MAG: FMN-binding protein [Phycisphaerae bacterium]|nr:FMN-binding protein [Phycisphaerae bacterium]